MIQLPTAPSDAKACPSQDTKPRWLGRAPDSKAASPGALLHCPMGAALALLAQVNI